MNQKAEEHIEILPDESNRYLTAALTWMDEARTFIRKQSRDCRSESKLKADHSLVTAVDLGVEKLFRSRVAETFPQHGIVGEELPSVNPTADFQWITDPIDGTQNLFHGVPTFASILGLFHRGKPVCGIIDHPMMDLRLQASRGNGTFENGIRVTIQEEDGDPIGKNDIVSLSTRAMFGRMGNQELFDSIASRFPNIRIYYDVLGESLTAAGNIALAFCWGYRIWDLAAAQILIEEAGGAYEIIRKEPKENGDMLYGVILGRKRAVQSEKKLFLSQ